MIPLLFAVLSAAPGPVLTKGGPYGFIEDYAPTPYEESGIVVRQYYDADMVQLISSPGPGVTGIHVLSKRRPYHPDGIALEEDFKTRLQDVRDAGLLVRPGFRIGRLYADCLTQADWVEAAKILSELVSLLEPDEFVVFDVENYGGDHIECTENYVLGQSSTYADVVTAVEPFTDIIQALALRVGVYPAVPEDYLVRALLAAGAPGSEAWIEKSFSLPRRYHTSTYGYREQLTVDVFTDITQMTKTNPHILVRWGLWDDVLREWGDTFRASNDMPKLAWAFDYTRSDRSSWGSASWLDGSLMNTANDATNVWNLESYDFNRGPLDEVSSQNFSSYYKTAAPGGQPRPWIDIDGWRPDGEWNALTDNLGAVTVDSYSITDVTFDDVAADRAILCQWESTATKNRFKLWLEAGSGVVLDVYDQSNNTTRIVVDASPAADTQYSYVFGFSGTTVRVEGLSDTTLPDTIEDYDKLRLGAIQESTDPWTYSEATLFEGQIIRWTRLLSAAEMTDIKGQTWPFDRGL